MRDVAGGILPSWQPIAERHRTESFTQQQRQWQLQRRGAYVCFNTLYDRGFRFGEFSSRLVMMILLMLTVITTPHDAVCIACKLCCLNRVVCWCRFLNQPEVFSCVAGLNGGRIESLMVSFPPLVAWNYKVVPEENSREYALLQVLKQPQDWV